MTSQFELVWLPLVLALLFLIGGSMVLSWRRKKLRGMSTHPGDSGSMFILGFSLLILSGFALFLGIFFLVTG